jgi:homoserine dehydrogenase
LREALTGDSVVSVHGILNGTCNYILTRMRNEGTSFDSILADAQKLGYAEANPSMDVDGHDAAQKLVVLSMLAFGAAVDVDSVPVEGIRDVDDVDFRFAARFDFNIKHSRSVAFTGATWSCACIRRWFRTRACSPTSMTC